MYQHVLNCIQMSIVLDLRAIYGHFAGTPFIQPRLASVDCGAQSAPPGAKAAAQRSRWDFVCLSASGIRYLSVSTWDSLPVFLDLGFVTCLSLSEAGARRPRSAGAPGTLQR